ncbi:hypothetical protein WICMUC_005906 [Wickerhamomyces mucosus]|uniref:SET domain-containing protein n=1 Tax=Wickerhamomyces mucosus TaxID=1378264 RepID=A0A9P8P1G1_9ASCO|nr:hypothetical protein WICMUC_005906 [Wickerhamomyces mucosus]
MELQHSNIQALLGWAKENGALIDPILEFKYKEGRGVYGIANRTLDVPSTSPQIKIPQNLIIKDDLAISHFGKLEGISVNGAIKLLVAKLKYSNGQVWANGTDLKSFFAPYINLLPQGKETNSVFFWNEEELKILENTNLGGALDDKLNAIFDEWLSLLKSLPSKFHDEEYKQDLEFANTFKGLKRSEFLEYLSMTTHSWTSFASFLWSTIIFTSRAFPHNIIDSKCQPGQAILLPLIDLLNHDNQTKVEWKYETVQTKGYFSLNNKDILKEGDEVLNNYGAKGNEELLLGYGFAIENNKNDSIALRVKLPLEKINSLYQNGVKIPRIEDYTQFAFDSSHQSDTSGPTEQDIQNGLLYFVNKSSLIPENLLQLFSFLNRNETENSFTLRSRLEALQQLRSALDRKKVLLNDFHVLDQTKADSKLIAFGDIYRQGQSEIYKLSISEIKKTEKDLLNQYKSKIQTLKKIYKRDEQLQELLSDNFCWNRYDIIEQEDFVDATLFIWIILHVFLASKDNYELPNFITITFKSLSLNKQLQVNEQFNDLAEYLLGIFKDHEIEQYLTAKNLTLASETIRLNSYTRPSTNEIIIVEPLSLLR